MAKSFYTAEEAAEKLGKTPEDLKNLVKDGTLREFRDGGAIQYKAEEIDALTGTGADSAIEGLEDTSSASGSIVLESAEDSGILLAPSGSDVLSLEELEPDDEAGATQAVESSKDESGEGSVITSVGMSVFDDDDLDESVDPLAGTAVSDVGGLGLEGIGSGSGILDLTQESDDTSLGADLFEDVAGTEEGEEVPVEMGDDTRAGLVGGDADEAILETEEEKFEPVAEEPEATTVTEAAAAAPMVVTTVEYGPDAFSKALTALMVVAVGVMLFGGLAIAALVKGISPGLIRAVYENLAMYTGGAVVVGIAVFAVSFLLAKRSQ